MTDLEMTKLCAEAMGLAHKVNGESIGISPYGRPLSEWHSFLLAYDPLHDDAQAMALVKEFGVALYIGDEEWWADLPELPRRVQNKDLNRAIVECVAQMQAETR